MADGDDIAAPDGGSVESTTVVGPAVTTVAPTTVVTVPAESGEPAEEPERPINFDLEVTVVPQDPQKLHLAHGKNMKHVVTWGNIGG